MCVWEIGWCYQRITSFVFIVILLFSFRFSKLGPVVNKRNYTRSPKITHTRDAICLLVLQPDAALTFAVWPERDFGRASASWRALLVFGTSVHSKKKHRTIIIRFSVGFFMLVSATASLCLFFCPTHPLWETFPWWCSKFITLSLGPRKKIVKIKRRLQQVWVLLLLVWYIIARLNSAQ